MEDHKIKLVTLFGGEGSEGQNALMTALFECSKDHFKLMSGEEMVYAYLEQTPKTSLIVELTDKLKQLGYKITKI